MQDREAPISATPFQRFVPEYYKLAQMPEEADVLDVCKAAGLDVKAYLVIETIHKLLRLEKRGSMLRDVNKSLEQLARLRDIVQAETDAKNSEQRERNREHTRLVPHYMGGVAWCARDKNKSCPSSEVCSTEGCQV